MRAGWGLRLIKAVAAGLFSLLAFSVPADTDPAACTAVLTPYEATYTSTVNGMRLEGHRTLSHDGTGELVLSQEVLVIDVT